MVSLVFCFTHLACLVGLNSLRDFEGLVWSFNLQRLHSRCLSIRDSLCVPNLKFPLWASSICQSLVLPKYLRVQILMRDQAPTAKASNRTGLLCTLRVFFFFFFLVLPVYCYQPLSLHPRAHMLSHVIPWTSARQTPLSMDFSRQEYWSGLPFPSPAPYVF